MSDTVARFDHDPRSMLEDLPTRWPDETLRGAVVIVINSEGQLLWDGAGYSKMELVWAMEKFKHELLFGEPHD